MVHSLIQGSSALWVHHHDCIGRCSAGDKIGLRVGLQWRSSCSEPPSATLTLRRYHVGFFDNRLPAGKVCGSGQQDKVVRAWGPRFAWTQTGSPNPRHVMTQTENPNNTTPTDRNDPTGLRSKQESWNIVTTLCLFILMPTRWCMENSSTNHPQSVWRIASRVCRRVPTIMYETPPRAQFILWGMFLSWGITT